MPVYGLLKVARWLAVAHDPPAGDSFRRKVHEGESVLE